MSQAVEAFRQISWLIFKWVLISVSLLIALGILTAVSVWGYNWYTHDRHVGQVEVVVLTDAKQCKDDKDYPIAVLIRNASGRTIEKVSFALAARRPGRSTDLAKYHSYEDDHLIEPKKNYGMCWRVPELREQVANPRELEWSIAYKTIHFKD